MDGITNSADMNLSKLWEIVEDRGVLQSMGSLKESKRVRHDLVTEQKQQLNTTRQTPKNGY